MKTEKGVLYVVATPIGNLQDCSPRALGTLRQVKRIAAEDTRHSRRLLTHYHINTALFSLHEHNEQQAGAQLLRMLEAGEDIALISDAGTPLLSDPGARFLSAVHEAGIQVVPIPGPSAVTTALSAAGLPAGQFVFEGFLPPKTQARRGRLQELAGEARTLVFYEAPHRIVDCLGDLCASFGGGREAVLLKELSKVHETVYRGSLEDLLTWITEKAERAKGEFVIVTAGAPVPEKSECSAESLRILRILCAELPLKQAAKLTARITTEPKNSLYAKALEMQSKNNKGI